MFLGNPARPARFQHITKWLRFGRTLKRIPHDCFNQIEDPDSDVPVRLHPVSKVFPKFLLKYCGTSGFTGH